MAKLYYNGVLLPERPSDATDEYWVILDWGDCTALYGSQTPWYFYLADGERPTIDNNSQNCRTYHLSDDGETWDFITATDGDWFRVDDEAGAKIIWSNHNIMNGSTTATEVYFWGSEPEDPEVPQHTRYSISKAILDGTARQIMRLTDSTAKVKPEEFEAKLESVKKGGGTELPSKVVYYNNMNGHEYLGIEAKKRRKDGTSSTIIDSFDLTSKWGSADVLRLTNGTISNDIIIHNTRASSVGNIRFTDSGYGSADCPGCTIGGWFRKTQNSNTWEYLLDMYGSKDIMLYISISENTFFYFTSVSAGAKTIDYSITLKEWFHVAVSVENIGNGSVRVSVYINGTLLFTETATYTIDFQQVLIGNVDYPFVGDAKNVFASWGALTAEEVRQMMLRD